MNIDSGSVRAKLVGQSEGVRSGIALFHCRDHESAVVSSVLHMIPLIPVGEGPTRADPLDGRHRISGEHPRHSEGLPRLSTDVIWKSFYLWWNAC